MRNYCANFEKVWITYTDNLQTMRPKWIAYLYKSKGLNFNYGQLNRKFTVKFTTELTENSQRTLKK
jgi:hypothetical protein